MNRLKTGMLFVLAVILMVFFVAVDPQLLVIPVGILLFLLRTPLRALFTRVSLPVAYLVLGTALGLLVEVFAILNFFHNPANSHLFSTNPVVDLTIAFGFYAMTTVGIYLVVRRWAISRKGLLVCSALYAIVIEQQGAVLLQGLASPLIAPFFWLYVTVVYLLWTWGTYFILERRFSKRSAPRLWTYVLLIVVMWVSALIGSIIGTGLSKLVGG